MHNRHWWFVCLALTACTQVVDFDRSKIPGRDQPDAGEQDDGGPGMDAGRDAGPGMDGGADADVPDVDAGPACDVLTHEGCADNELCCPGSGGASCVTTDPGQCSACNTEAEPLLGACDVATASRCAGRQCECVPGSGVACAGDAPRCVADACVDCVSDEDCTEAGAGQCVDGVCSACDFADAGTGCANPTPICLEDNTCVGCDGSHACQSPLSCDDGSCFGCVLVTNLGCGGSTPICEQTSPGVFECVGCTLDVQCGGQQCVPQSSGGACQVCDPTDGQRNEGCTSASSPICAGTPAACVACDAVSSDDDINNAACNDETLNTVCVSSGARRGQCRTCDPTDDDGCSGTTDQCNPVDNTCVDCIGGAGCGGNQVCVTGGNSCVECNTDAECTDEATDTRCKTSTHTCEECLTSADCGGAEPICNTGTNRCGSCVTGGGDAACAARTPGSVCITSGARAGECGTCDPADDGGCTAPNDQCNPTTLTCVDCIGAAGCGANQVCLTGGNSCVECNVTGDCSGGEVCDTSSHTCVECLSNTQCSGAQPICDTGSNVCESCVTGGGDAACAARTPGSVCITSGARAGECGTCDPADDGGCTAPNDQCNPTTISCVDCIGAAGCGANAVCITGGNRCVECNVTGDCSGADVCDTASNTCVECLSAAQCGNEVCNDNACEPCANDAACASHPTGAQCALVGASRQCRVCDPATLGDTADDEGCAMGQICNETTFVCE